jgi:carotenoid cleavage dioxygenase
MQAGFAPTALEVEAFDLEVTGSLPPELDGLYVRIGSNPAGEASPHWFLGDGMVHGVVLAGGQALWYCNRYVDTPLYHSGRGVLGTGGAPGGENNQANVSVFHHGDTLLAPRARSACPTRSPPRTSAPSASTTVAAGSTRR